jgi:hypothetical protein
VIDRAGATVVGEASGGGVLDALADRPQHVLIAEEPDRPGEGLAADGPFRVAVRKENRHADPPVRPTSATARLLDARRVDDLRQQLVGGGLSLWSVNMVRALRAVADPCP